MKPRVLFLSGREVGYIRNRVLLQALRQYCDVLMYTAGIRGTPSRTVAGLARFIARHPDYDLCFAGFYGQPIAIALSVLQPKPIVFDAYVSTYDTLCDDRGWFSHKSLPGRLAHWLDRRSCEVSTQVITDTQAQANYFRDTFGVAEEKVSPVYVGCDETVFYAREPPPVQPPRFEVFHYGSFLPLHGTEVIVRAAAVLRHRQDIHFILGGDGARRTSIERMIAGLKLTNVEFIGWIPFQRLPDHIARASICLGGHFSTVPKAARVISSKTFQFVAMRKPTIVADTSATRELFVPGEHVYAVPMGNARALADAIYHLTDDEALRRRISDGGYDIFQRRLTTRAIAEQLAFIIRKTIDESGP